MKLSRLAVIAALLGGVALAAASGRPHAEPVTAAPASPAGAATASPAASSVMTASKHEITVLDGQTVRVAGTELQLSGVTAPALRQQCVRDGRVEPCGEAAAQALQKIIDLAVKPVECRRESDGGALCFVDGRDAGEALVLQGRALAADDRYTEAQAQARKGKLGLWASAWVPPEEWRHGARMPEELAARSRAPAAERKPELAHRVPVGATTE